MVFRCLESSDFQPSAAKKFIDQRFVLDVSFPLEIAPDKTVVACLASGSLRLRGSTRERFPEDNSSQNIWQVPGSEGLHQETDQQHLLQLYIRDRET